MSRKITILCLVTFFSAMGVAQSASAQRNLLNETPLPSSRLLNRFGLERVWWGQATLNSSRDIIKHIAIDERSVIVISSSGIVTAFDAESGLKMWVTRIGRREQTSFMPVLNEKQVLIVSGLNLYALDRLKGGVTWEISLPQVPSTGPSTDDDQVYIGTLDGSIYAFDLRKIKELYQERLLPEYTLSTQVWRYKSGRTITSPPVVSDRSVSFASLDRSLYTVSARTRKLLYQFETDGAITAPIVKNKQYIFLASEDFNFYCLNAENGQVRWSFLSGLPIRKSSYVIDDHVFVLPDAGGIFALNVDNGSHAWPRPQLRAVNFLAASRQLVFASDQLGSVLLLDRTNGGVVGTLPLIPFNVKPNNALTDRLFLAKKNGLIVMIREQGSDFPTYHKHPQRRPLLPELHDPKAAGAEPAEKKSPKPESSEEEK